MLPRRSTTIPYTSKRQWRWAFATGQPWARRWADETPGGEGRRFRRLPERAAKAEEAPAAPGKQGAGPGGKPMSPAERARHAALVRWGKKNPFAQRLAAVRKRKGGGKGKAPKAPKPDKAAEKEQQRAANMAAAAEALMDADAPIGKVGLDALTKFAEGEALDAGMAKELAALGVVTLGADGTPRLNPAGRALLRAAEKGDARAVVDAAFAAGERVGVGAAGETLPGWEQGEDGTRRKAKAPKEGADAPDKAGAEAEKKRGGGGGGGGKEAKPTPEERKQQQAEARAQTARDTAEAVGLSAAEADFLRGAAEDNLPDGSFDARRLMELGLVVDDGDTTITTDQGRRALLALERGDRRGYQAALQDVRAATQRKADQEARRAEAEANRAKAKADAEAARQRAERDEVTALLDDWEAGRTGLSYRDQRRAVRAGLARYDDAGNIRRVKPRETKTADPRAAALLAALAALEAP